MVSRGQWDWACHSFVWESGSQKYRYLIGAELCPSFHSKAVCTRARASKKSAVCSLKMESSRTPKYDCNRGGESAKSVYLPDAYCSQ